MGKSADVQIEPGLYAGFLKDFEEQLDPLSCLRPPAVDVSKPREGQGLPCDLWAEETQQGIQVAPIESVDQFPHDLNVLLRHRPSSISRRTEGAAFHAKQLLELTGQPAIYA
jgi:hypothetical protein